MPTFSVDSETTLKPLELQNADELFALVDANRERLRKWLPWVDHNNSAQDSREFIERSLEKTAAQEELTYGIWSNERIAGVVGVFLRAKAPTAEIGYWIGSEFEGRGLITKSVAALLPDLFETRDLNRVEIQCAPANLRSRAIPERLGFQLEGTLREADRLYDRFVDNCIYGLLRSEWREEPLPAGGTISPSDR